MHELAARPSARTESEDEMDCTARKGCGLMRVPGDLFLVYRRERITFEDGTPGTRYQFGYWPWLLLGVLAWKLTHR
jgi:hypothetical protein